MLYEKESCPLDRCSLQYTQDHVGMQAFGTCALERFIFVQCLCYFSPDVMTNRNFVNSAPLHPVWLPRTMTGLERQNKLITEINFWGVLFL